MRAVSAAQMRAIDQKAQKVFGVPELILMEHAGLAVARSVQQHLKKERRRSGSVVVLAGGGANGGDGFVAARHLDNWGISVQVVLLASPGKLKGAARTHFEMLKKLKVPRILALTPAGWSRWLKSKPRILLVVDAMLGTGMKGQVREPYRTAIQWLNRIPCLVIAVDLPSGLSADEGKPLGVAVRATTTVTCGLPKIGLRAPEARGYTGRLSVADIALPQALRGNNA